MTTLLDNQQIAYFIDSVIELREDCVVLQNDAINQQFNSSNSSLTNLIPPYPYLNGVWQLVNDEWICINQEVVDNYLAFEKQNFNQQQKIKRQTAYTVESDPIYFMWQRGEATQEQWLNKIEEIKLRYPYEV